MMRGPLSHFEPSRTSKWLSARAGKRAPSNTGAHIFH
jgi:hypothetical protein